MGGPTEPCVPAHGAGGGSLLAVQIRPRTPGAVRREESVRRAWGTGLRQGRRVPDGGAAGGMTRGWTSAAIASRPPWDASRDVVPCVRAAGPWRAHARGARCGSVAGNGRSGQGTCATPRPALNAFPRCARMQWAPRIKRLGTVGPARGVRGCAWSMALERSGCAQPMPSNGVLTSGV